MNGVMRPGVSAGSKSVGARLKWMAHVIWPAGASAARADVAVTAISARAITAMRGRRLVMNARIVSDEPRGKAGPALVGDYGPPRGRRRRGPDPEPGHAGAW